MSSMLAGMRPVHKGAKSPPPNTPFSANGDLLVNRDCVSIKEQGSGREAYMPILVLTTTLTSCPWTD